MEWLFENLPVIGTGLVSLNMSFRGGIALRQRDQFLPSVRRRQRPGATLLAAHARQ